MIPNAYISAGNPYTSSLTSGAIYKGVPILFVYSSLIEYKSSSFLIIPLHNPKSPILTSFLELINIFYGLKNN